MKKCPQCKEIKFLRDFSPSKSLKYKTVYYSWCRLCTNKKARTNYQKHRTYKIEYARQYRSKHPEEVKTTIREYQRKLRMVVLRTYSAEIPFCNCCGEQEIKFLAVDHINGGGHKHNQELKRRGQKFYQWLRINNYPAGFQILCHNCNLAKGLYGKCPHREITGITDKKSTTASNYSGRVQKDTIRYSDV